MTDSINPAGSSAVVNLATFERMLSVVGPALRPALVAQVLADLERLRAALCSGAPVAMRHAAHELKGIAATIGADSLAGLAAGLDQSLEQGMQPDRAAAGAALWQQLDALSALLRADSRRVTST